MFFLLSKEVRDIETRLKGKKWGKLHCYGEMMGWLREAKLNISDIAHTTKLHLTAWQQEAEGAYFLLSLLVKYLYAVNICKPLARTNSTCSEQQKQGLLQPWEFFPVKSLRGRRDRISGTSWSITKPGQVHKHPDKAVAGDWQTISCKALHWRGDFSAQS